ncbi:hypothetical protein FRC15_011424 [Serendipita sp. 397]|nr:hypothetical protein FRC15_011424 [Serendipita sp. 397]
MKVIIRTSTRRRLTDTWGVVGIYWQAFDPNLLLSKALKLSAGPPRQLAKATFGLLQTRDNHEALRPNALVGSPGQSKKAASFFSFLSAAFLETLPRPLPPSQSPPSPTTKKRQTAPPLVFSFSIHHSLFCGLRF